MTISTIDGASANLKTFGLAVSGVVKSYDLQTYRQAIADGTVTTPALLVTPNLDDDKTQLKTRTFMGNAPTLKFALMHHYLYAPVAGNADLYAMLPLLQTALDNYIAAFKADPFIKAGGVDPASHSAPLLIFSDKPQRIKWEAEYYGYVFKYEMSLNL